MIAVVLAAGRGVRLGGGVPKPLRDIGGTAAIDRILDTLAVDGIDDAVVVTGHRAGEVEEHLERRPVRFARQPEPIGTANALLAARDAVGDAPFLVTWADVLVEPGAYRTIVEAGAGCDGAVGVNHLDDLSAGGAVEVVDGLVAAIEEKPGRRAGWNHTGVSAYGPEIWPHLGEVGRSERGEHELPDAVNAWIEAGALLAAVSVPGAIFEIGTPEGLAAATLYWTGEIRCR